MADETEKEYQLIRMTSNSQHNKGLLEDIVRVIKGYSEKPPIGEKDYGKTIKSDRFLRQCMDFDATDTKLFDAVMGGGYTLLGMEIYLNILLSYQQDVYTNTNFNAIMNAFARN